MRLIVFHSHYRAGGVRRIIELALPALVNERRLGVKSVVLAGGEVPGEKWTTELRARLAGVPVTCAINAAAGYVSETRGKPMAPAARRAELEKWVAALLDGGNGADTVVWAHNLGLGRNLAAAGAWVHACGRRGVRLVAHHHDWWFDNRWQRWPEMRRTGGRSLAAVAQTIFSTAAHVRHATINRADQRVLARGLGARAGWLPNLAEAGAAPSKAAVDAARAWLDGVLGERAPVWLVPCRMLRRKNFAEALLLTRWLRPEAWLVTTGGVSSAEEQSYAAALQAAATRHGWRVKLGVLAGTEDAKPTVAALLAASEAVLLTSLQEGFGLPNLEASAAGRPLLVRTLANIAPDLAEFGFRFPQAYDEVWIERGLFDARAETARQETRWRAWRAGLPRTCRAWATRPPWWDAAGPVALSRLTLTAQLEVLAHPAEESWARCAPLNPVLRRWRGRAETETLGVSRWPRGAARRLGAEAYGRGFARLLATAPGAVADGAPGRIAEEFLRAKLAGENQYPMLWSLTP
jgi:glycosyltransferase involved in cell wall biosynthesis